MTYPQQVTFDYSAWVALFPEFTNITQPAGQMYFNMATLLWANDYSGDPCTYVSPDQQIALLNLLTAHYAWLFAPRDDKGNPATGGSGQASPLVGRISSATEGSVSVQSENDYPPGSAQWFQQTRYGSMFWIAIGPFMTARYVPGPQRIFDPWNVFGYPGGWPGPPF